MSNKVIMVKDIVEENGKTVEENNLALKHNIPIGTIVKIQFEDFHHEDKITGTSIILKGEATLYVCEHTRDCDGTPLYTLGSTHQDLEIAKETFFMDMREMFSYGRMTPREQSLAVENIRTTLSIPMIGKTFFKKYFNLIEGYPEEALETVPFT